MLEAPIMNLSLTKNGCILLRKPEHCLFKILVTINGIDESAILSEEYVVACVIPVKAGDIIAIEIWSQDGQQRILRNLFRVEAGQLVASIHNRPGNGINIALISSYL